MTTLLSVPMPHARAAVSHSNAVPAMYRHWATERLACLLERKPSVATTVRRAASSGGRGIGRLMLSRNALPDLPGLSPAATSDIPLNVTSALSAEDRAGLAAHAADLLAMGIMRECDLQIQGPKITGREIGIAAMRAVARHVDLVNARALAMSPFKQCRWAPFYFDVQDPTQPHAEHPISVELTVCDTILTGTPGFSTPFFASAFRMALDELARQSRYGLVVGQDDTLGCMSPWLLEQLQDLMIDMRWEEDRPVFAPERVEQFHEEFGWGETDDGEPLSEDILELVRHLHRVQTRPKVSRTAQRALWQKINRMRGSEALLISGIIQAAKVLEDRPRLSGGGAIGLDSDTTYPSLFVLGDEIADNAMHHSMLDGYGSEGVGAFLSAPWGSTRQFVAALEDVVLEASIVSDAMSAIAYHE